MAWQGCSPHRDNQLHGRVLVSTQGFSHHSPPVPREPRCPGLPQHTAFARHMGEGPRGWPLRWSCLCPSVSRGPRKAHTPVTRVQGWGEAAHTLAWAGWAAAQVCACPGHVHGHATGMCVLGLCMAVAHVGASVSQHAHNSEPQTQFHTPLLLNMGQCHRTPNSQPGLGKS